jgi:hypothetical protein
MAEVHVNIIAHDPSDYERTIRELAQPYIPVEPGVSASAFHQLHAERDRLQNEVSSLKRESGNISADVIEAAYKDGERDAKAEMQQEKASARYDKLAMLAHTTVLVMLEPGRAPFAFQPKYVTTFGKIPDIELDEANVPQYQRELIGTEPNTVGIYGLNMVTRRPMFLVQIDSWTLAPNS